MKKVLTIIVILAIVFGAIGCSNQEEIATDNVIELTIDDIADKVYVYEKEGFGSEFTIEIKSDGTFTYYEGAFSSHIGIGEWSYSDGVITLFEKTSRLNEAFEFEEVINSYCFSVEKDMLIFLDKGVDESSANFRYIKVSDGEKFFAK